jgi:hypothetical protein
MGGNAGAGVSGNGAGGNGGAPPIGCVPLPARDEAECTGTLPPHFYRCVQASPDPGLGCVIVPPIMDLTNFYCCN